MRTSQVAKLTGVSVRTLQYYDEIGLLKPSKLTPSGYRLYDDAALQTLQQILFYKELGFQLKEIQEMIKKPDLDRTAAFQKQKELFLLKRNRIDRLIQLLEHLEKGEPCMSFKEFDLSDYMNALEDFKASQPDEVLKHWGSIRNFDLLIQKVRDDESEIAKLAIKQFGSTEKYTEAMKYQLKHFSEIMESQMTEEAQEISQRFHMMYRSLTADLSKDVSSPEVQDTVHSILQLVQKNSTDTSPGKPYLSILIDSYSSDYGRAIADDKYGEGASEYIVKAFRYFSENNCV